MAGVLIALGALINDKVREKKKANKANAQNISQNFDDLKAQNEHMENIRRKNRAQSASQLTGLPSYEEVTGFRAPQSRGSRQSSLEGGPRKESLGGTEGMQSQANHYIEQSSTSANAPQSAAALSPGQRIQCRDFSTT
jgi:hypothetical protein